MLLILITNKIPITSVLLNETQYGLNKQGLEKKIGDGDEKTPNIIDLVMRTGYNKKLQRLKTRYLFYWFSDYCRSQYEN